MATDNVWLARTAGGAEGGTAASDPVAVPLDGLRGARGLVAGAPDAGIEAAPATLARLLHAAGQSVLLVEGDGARGSFAEGHDVRLAGDDPNADIRVAPANAERLVTIAGEGAPSVVLDVASFGNTDAGEVLGRIVETLSSARRERLSLVVIIADCHEWLPDAGETACGESMLAVEPDPASGVGVVGVTDRPSGVDTAFCRSCDWIAAHRVTWRDHVDAVTRLLGREQEEALASLDDGEVLLDGPWLDAVERVRFESAHRQVGAGGCVDDHERRNREPDPARRSRVPANGVGIEEVAGEVADLRDRIDDLEAAVSALEDPTAIVDDLADGIAERLDGTAVTGTGEAPTETGAADSGREVDTASADGQSTDASDGGFGDVFDAFAGGDDEGASRTAPSTDDDAGTARADQSTDDSRSSDAEADSPTAEGGMSFEPMNFAFDEGASGGAARPDDVGEARSGRPAGERRVPRYVRDLVRTVKEMDSTTRKMLAHYVDRGADTPLNAHFSAGGSGDRTAAYAHNRQLRTTGFLEHVGRGNYSPTIPEKVRETATVELSTAEVSTAVEHVRRALP